MIKFPKGFFWGAATSAYQVEGGNSNCDWWEWEKRVNKEPSGEACRSHGLYEEDFNLAAELNHNAHRLSIEWSRIEPKQGEFSSAELDHYRNVLSVLRERGLEPIVTLHHFTNPLWFSELGGWQNKKSSEYFLRFVRKAVDYLSGDVRFWVTINEPMVYVYHAYILGQWPPQEKSVLKGKTVTDNLVAAHIKAYKAIHAIYKQRNLQSCFVSIAKNIQFFQPCVATLRNKFSAYLRDRYYNFDFIRRILRYKSLDYIGVNYYSRSVVELKKLGIANFFTDTCETKEHNQLKKNSLGWDIYPEGLYNLLIKFKRFNLPIFILENGICTDDDNLRWDFIREHLKAVNRAIGEGINILGYIYWSLIDNFEWDKGFGPRFGLIEVDYNTYKRRVRESARKFAQVCKTEMLDA